MRQLAGLLLGLLIAALLFGSPSQAEGRRYALVIGNSTYVAVPTLPNPTNDASDIGGALTRAGFDVTYGLNVNRREFMGLLDKFAARSADGDAVVFFYAGHGFELDKVNYLVPVDARLRNRAAIARETVDLNTVIDALQKPGRPSVVFLDACRNSPLPPEMRSSPGNEGLAEVDTGRDLFVAFAAEPHKTARSGLGRNSPFTQALLTHLRRPGLSISDLMVDVRKDVYLATEGGQLPWDQSSLRSQFFFIPTLSITEQLATAGKTGQSGSATAAPDPGERSSTVGNDGQEADSSAGAPAPETSAADPGEAAAPAAETSAAPPPAAPDKAGKLRSTAKTEKDHTVKKPVATKKRPPAGKPAKTRVSSGKKPSAVGYSLKVWPLGSIAKGRRVRQQTEFGELVCIFQDERALFSPRRFCRFH